MPDVFNGSPGVGGFNTTQGDIRYVNEQDHTKAAHDLMRIDAGSVDGIEGAQIVRSVNGNLPDVLGNVAVAGGGGSGGSARYVSLLKFGAV